MANETKPSAPAKSPQGQPVDPIAATGAKAGFDPLRPFKYLYAFTKGTLVDGLNGLANGANRGMWLGVIAGIVIPMILLTPSFAILSGALMGAVAGAALGGTIGFATGGIKGVTRIRRAEHYAEDLLKKEKAKTVDFAPNRSDYREAYRDYKQKDFEKYLRFDQAEREVERDTNTYWRDRLHSQNHGHGHDRGF